MGILLSVLQYLEGLRDTIFSPNTSYNCYSNNSNQRSEYSCQDDILKSSHQLSNRDYYPTQTYQMKHLTVSVPNLRSKPSSLVHRSGNYKVKSSKENAPGNVHIAVGSSSRGKETGQLKIKIEVKWIKHYNSCQQILLVGEGDFSFSACLAKAFGLASNMVATSLDSPAFVVKNYGNGFLNIMNLIISKCIVMHEVDATTMANHEFLGGIKFDRIIFNFPFAGFFKNLPRDSQLRLHRRLVSLFLKNAKEMISENGEIHISHKTNGFHREWNLESLASPHRLYLIEAVDFNLMDYPGYNTKCGFGGDNNFNCYPSKTYKFGLIS